MRIFLELLERSVEKRRTIGNDTERLRTMRNETVKKRTQQKLKNSSQLEGFQSLESNALALCELLFLLLT